MTVIRINGAWMDAQTATVSVLDRGFLLGDGVFETVRVYGGRAFLLAEHLERLQASARAVGIGVAETLRQEIDEALARFGDADAVLRITVTRGVGGFGLDARSAHTPTRVVSVMPLPAMPSSLYERGVALQISASRRHDDTGVPATVKATSYLQNVMALSQAHAQGFDDALLLNARGELAEATSANVFVLLEDRWCTPPTDVLLGLTRQTLLTILGDEAREQALSVTDLSRARAVVLTSSVREVVPVRAIGEKSYDLAASTDLLRRYRAHVHKVLA